MYCEAPDSRTLTSCRFTSCSWSARLFSLRWNLSGSQFREYVRGSAAGGRRSMPSYEACLRSSSSRWIVAQRATHVRHQRPRPCDIRGLVVTLDSPSRATPFPEQPRGSAWPAPRTCPRTTSVPHRPKAMMVQRAHVVRSPHRKVPLRSVCRTHAVLRERVPHLHTVCRCRADVRKI